MVARTTREAEQLGGSWGPIGYTRFGRVHEEYITSTAVSWDILYLRLRSHCCGPEVFHRLGVKDSRDERRPAVR